jgi:hypothetical protein
MAPPLLYLPSEMNGERLFRFTYEGPTNDCKYRYDLSTTQAGYDALVTIRSRDATGRVTRDDVYTMLLQTTRAMRDLTNEQTEWEPDLVSLERVSVRMHLPKTGTADFGEVAGRIIEDLPRLLEATIMAYYR